MPRLSMIVTRTTSSTIIGMVTMAISGTRITTSTTTRATMIAVAIRMVSTYGVLLLSPIL